MEPTSAAFAPTVIVILALGTIAWMTFWAGHIRRQGSVLAERIDILERRLAQGAAETLEAAHAQAPGEGLPVGAVAPVLAFPPVLDRPSAILFVSSSCPPCTPLLREVASWRERFGKAASIEVVNRDDANGRRLADGFRARWAPSAVLVGHAGRIASPLANGTEAVRGLFSALHGSIAGEAVDEHALHRQLNSRLGNSSVVVGDAAPPCELFGAKHQRDAGADTLLLFWDPGCSYCQGMAGALKAIEAAPPAGAPRLAFVIPRHAADASQAQAVFSSPSYFDPDARIAPLFGARGTPSAVLVNRVGRIASTVALGKDAILSLLAPAPAELSDR